MSNTLLDILEGIGTVADTPGSVARGLLAGRPDRAFGGIFDPAQRVSGRGLLEEIGLLNAKTEDEGFGMGDVAGIGVSLLTDPLTYLPLGLGAKAAMSSKATSAARRMESSLPMMRVVEGITPSGGSPLVKAIVQGDVAPSVVKMAETVAAAPKQTESIAAQIGSKAAGSTAKEQVYSAAQQIAGDLPERMRAVDSRVADEIIQKSGEASKAGKNALQEFGELIGLPVHGTKADMLKQIKNYADRLSRTHSQTQF